MRSRMDLALVAGLSMGVLVGCGSPIGPTAPPTTSQASPSATGQVEDDAPPFAVDAARLTPPLTAELPAWAASVKVDLGPGSYNYTGPDSAGPNSGRGIRLYSVMYMYPLGSAKMRTHPSYDQMVASYKEVQTLGYGTVGDVAAASVDGRSATTMTVALTKDVYGLAGCPTAVTDRTSCTHAVAGRVQRVTLVDNGAGKPVTLLFESWNRVVDSDDAPVLAEAAAWLSTVKFR
jgi:hypothetical protein